MIHPIGSVKLDQHGARLTQNQGTGVGEGEMLKKVERSTIKYLEKKEGVSITEIGRLVNSSNLLIQNHVRSQQGESSVLDHLPGMRREVRGTTGNGLQVHGKTCKQLRQRGEQTGRGLREGGGRRGRVLTGLSFFACTTNSISFPLPDSSPRGNY